MPGEFTRFVDKTIIISILVMVSLIWAIVEVILLSLVSVINIKT